MPTYIKFRNAAFVCESPVLTNAVYTDIRWDFLLSWTSMGDVYSTFDPNTKLNLYVSFDDEPYEFVTEIYSFNEVDYNVNLNSFGIDPKTKVTFKLTLVNSGCNNTSNEIIVPVT